MRRADNTIKENSRAPPAPMTTAWITTRAPARCCCLTSQLKLFHLEEDASTEPAIEVYLDDL